MALTLLSGHHGVAGLLTGLPVKCSFDSEATSFQGALTGSQLTS